MALSVQLLSDLHLEFHADEGKQFINSVHQDVDVLVLAGDVNNAHGIEKSLVRICQKYENSHVLFVAGNHEYYHSDFFTMDNVFRDLESKIDNLTWLENKRIEIDGKGFLGCTLWFPETEEAKSQKLFFNDFRLIKQCDPYPFLRHEESARFLKASIQEGDIVTTHHLPSEVCVDPIYKFSSINCYFVVEMRDVMLTTWPEYWFYGHTHTPGTQTVGGTKLICNSFGYATELKRRFKSDLIIEV